MASRAEVLRDIRGLAFEMMERIHNTPSLINRLLIVLEYCEAMRDILVAFLPPHQHDPFVLSMICHLIDFDYDDFVARE